MLRVVVVSRLFLNSILVVAACAPLILLVGDMVQRYPLDISLLDISIVDAVLLLVALAIPLGLLQRLDVNWRNSPDDF